MNISAAHLPIQSSITPIKVAGVADTPLNASATVNTTHQPVSNTTSPSIPNSVNPTYDKPTFTEPTGANVPANEAEKTANQAGQQVSPDEASGAQEASKKVSPDSPQLGEHSTYSEAELEVISSLKSRDAEVSSHERAHAAVGGQHAGSPTYSYKTGPDGVKYAVSGEVSIDTSKVSGDPQATLQKAQQIKAAALAPAEPSGQDRKVAAKADQMASEARSDLQDNNSGEKSNRVSSSSRESNAPDHFTGQQNLAIEGDPESHSHIDSTIQAQMSERSFHINAHYQSSASTITSPSFEIQA
ncbi:putative metalloprotease CJM1_0395 family protein [Psychromonas sp. Urea-02u-13]|uniref:putative metalloprotease CJM1_0395 family protein n=1 Tax=Psychromonas sp. Urea-02u-13 TaxID=2058326 RepID=UPI000C32343E|nr:putative metalloprotease CJM1_0395 family protein [Psychromonas sp. Urea-02u-13]PKG39953.1 hypothetical protein CXF74_05145 [Psychromonas sp. Urea-02u-13]